MALMLLVCPGMQVCKAQATENWQMFTLNIHDGTNQVDGVQGFCQVTKCNGTEVVMLKLINLNDYSVKAGWKDLVLTKDDRRLSANVAQDSVTIGPKKEIKGDCTGNTVQLVLKLSDFGTDIDNFKDVIASDFDFVIIH